MIWRILKSILMGVEILAELKGDQLHIKICYGKHAIVDRYVDIIPD